VKRNQINRRTEVKDSCITKTRRLPGNRRPTMTSTNGDALWIDGGFPAGSRGIHYILVANTLVVLTGVTPVPPARPLPRLTRKVFITNPFTGSGATIDRPRQNRTSAYAHLSLCAGDSLLCPRP